MAPGSYTINMEAPTGTPLAHAIEHVKSWLNKQQMKPIRLASEVRGQILLLEIEFNTWDEAFLFERDFS
jgi:hypothetical protein